MNFDQECNWLYFAEIVIFINFGNIQPPSPHLNVSLFHCSKNRMIKPPLRGSSRCMMFIGRVASYT